MSICKNTPVQSAEYDSFRRDLRCAARVCHGQIGEQQRNCFNSLRFLLKISKLPTGSNGKYDIFWREHKFFPILAWRCGDNDNLYRRTEESLRDLNPAMIPHRLSLVTKQFFVQVPVVTHFLVAFLIFYMALPEFRTVHQVHWTTANVVNEPYTLKLCNFHNLVGLLRSC